MQQVTMATDLSSSFDKWCSLFVAILSGAAAAAVLLLCPRGVLSIDTAAATSTLSQATAAMLSQRGLEPDAQVRYESSLTILCFLSSLDVRPAPLMAASIVPAARC